MKYSERLVVAATPDTNAISVDRAKADLKLREAQINLDMLNIKDKLESAKSAKTLKFEYIYELDSQMKLKERELKFLNDLYLELF